MGDLGLHQKIKNIRQDSRVALSFLSDKSSENGMREYVVVHGHARVTEGGAVPFCCAWPRFTWGAVWSFPRHRCGTSPAM